MKNGMAFKIVGAVFLIMALAHLLRLFFRTEIIVGGWAVPLWFSVVAFIVTLLLAIWILKSIK